MSEVMAPQMAINTTDLVIRFYPWPNYSVARWGDAMMIIGTKTNNQWEVITTHTHRHPHTYTRTQRTHAPMHAHPQKGLEFGNEVWPMRWSCTVGFEDGKHHTGLSSNKM